MLAAEKRSHLLQADTMQVGLAQIGFNLKKCR